MSGVSITTPISRHISSAPPRLPPLPGRRGRIARPQPPFIASRAALSPWHPTCKPYWPSGLIFLTGKECAQPPRRIARHDLPPPHEPHEDGPSERLHAH